MSLLGKFMNVAGQAVCAIGGVGIAATGEILGVVGDLVSDDSKFSDGVRSVTLDVGKSLFYSGKSFGNGCEKVVDTTFAAAGELGGEIAGGVAKFSGANNQQVETAKKIGRVAAGVGLGVVVGDVVQGALIGAAAGGAASTGTAIASLNGAAASNATLAALGGGSLATGGLGMAGGQALLTGIDVVTAVDGANAGATSKQKLERESNSIKCI